MASDNCGAVVVEWVADSTNNQTCPETITRTYRATDDCGNVAECGQLIIIRDTIAPTFDSIPVAEKDITCISELDEPSTLTAKDNCGNATVRFSVDPYTIDQCEGFDVVYRWIAEDVCGNSDTVTTIYHILKDTIAPVFTAEPQIIANIGCADTLPAPEVLTATDNCGSATVVHSIDPYSADKCAGYTITYRWIASDACGNVSEKTQSFMVVPDTIGPVFTRLPDSIPDIHCNDPLPAAEILTATDLCGTATVVTSTDPYIADVCNGYSVTYRWIATDECGNSNEDSVTFRVLPDNEPPVFTGLVPSDLTLLCSDSLPAFATLTAIDNCGTVTITTSVDPYTADLCSGFNIIYRWTATDDCGNVAETTQTIHILPDNSAPAFDKAPDPIADILCSDSLPVQEVLTASFDCGTTAVVQSVDPYTVDLCNGYQITYRWTVTDACNNHAEATRTFRVLPDTIPPVFAAQPNDLPDIQCSDLFPAIDSLTATDACGNVSVTTSIDPYVVDKCNGYTVTYRWKATDACGNSAETTKSFRVLPDTIPPVFDSAPAALADITCTDSLPAIETLTASDNCGSAVVVSSIDPYAVNQCAGYPVTYRWSATDECGNTFETTQTFRVLPDTIKPVFDNLPGPDVWLSCNDSLPAQEILTATDNCGVATVTPSIDPYTVDLCNGFIITYRWTASDECGNLVEVTRKINIRDTIPPTADPLPEIGPFACYDEIPAPNPAVVTGLADNCSSQINVSFKNDTKDPGCEGVVLRTYIIEDECRNSIEIIQPIHIKDTIPPTADTLPTIGPVACFADIPAPDISVVTGEMDNCSDTVFVSFIGDSAGSGCSGNVVRTYLLEDLCGNTSRLNQFIIVNDTIAPTADPLPDMGPFSCYGEIPAPDTSLVTGMLDNCVGNVYVAFGGDSEDPGCEGTVIRTYIISDDCNNQAFIVQNIHIKDTVPPVADSIPAMGPFACYDDIPAPDVNVVTGESDNCGKPVKVEFIADSDSLGCTGVIYRTYQVADTCGNYISLIQTIYVKDTIPPTADPLPNLGPYACFGEIPVANISVVQNEMDNCSDSVRVEFIGETGDPGCEGTVLRTYRITDLCDNYTDLIQTIYIKDTIPPTGNPLPDLGPFACYSDIPLPDSTLITGISDNCSDSVSVFFVSDSDDPGCEGTVVRRYVIVDECGNTTAIVQNIAIRDTIPPTADTLPTIGPFACYEERPAANTGDVTGETDNCSPTVKVTFIGDSTDPGCSGTVTRTYKVEDLCGNFIEVSQLILFRDTIGPEFKIKPSDFTITCEAPLPYMSYAEFVAAGGLITDNCHTLNNSFSFISDSTTTGNCPRNVYRTYRVWDNCGNSTDFVQIITVVDNIAPILTCPPTMNVFPFMVSPFKYDTYTMFIEAGGFADDNCALDTASFALIMEVSDSLINPERIVRTYMIKDSCGNVTTCDHVLFKYSGFDFAVVCPPDLFLDCTEDIPAPFSTYSKFVAGGGYAGSEICGVDTSSLELVFSDEIDSCPRIITRVYALSDTCGNSKFCTHQIIINDLEAPAMSCPPTLNLAEGESIPPAYTTYNDFENGGGFASDNCQIDYSSFVLVSEASDGNLFPETITRIYQIADWCGNTTICSQKIIITHTSDITMSCPAGEIVECFGDIPAAYQTLDEFLGNGGTVTGTCGLDSLSFRLLSETNSLAHCPDTLLRTYEISDTCGASVFCTQMFIIDDNTPPTITCPPTIQITVGGNLPLPLTTFERFIIGSGHAEDNCQLDSASFRVVSDISDGQLYPETFVRTYEIADMCGNTVSCEHVVTLMHDLNIDLVCPPMVSVECENNIPAPFNTFAEFTVGGGKASGSCGIDPNSFRFVADSSDNKICPETIFRKYQISDSCGNSVVCSQLIRIQDITPPTIVCPGDTVLPFNIPLSAAYATFNEFIAAGGGASDNCGLDSTSFRLLSQETIVTGTPSVVRRVYEIADMCGNTATCEMQITVSGNAEAVLVCPSDIDVECYSDIPKPYNSFNTFITQGGKAFSECGIDPATFRMISQLSDGNKCPEMISRIYSVLDSCGNEATCTQRIFIEDKTNPTLVCPGDLVVKTNADKPAPYPSVTSFTLAGGLADDNCGLMANSFRMLTEVSNGKINPEIVTRTYEVADSCGNTATCEQQITITGDAALIISCPPNQTVSCPDDIPNSFKTLAEFTAGGGKVSGNCNILVSSFRLVSETSEGFCPQVISRTYSISDDCGNKEECTMQIIVNDTQEPTLGYQPKAVVVDCDVPPPFKNYDQFKAAGGVFNDNCGIDESTFRLEVEIPTIVSKCKKYIDRYYTILDFCGNQGYYTHRITVEDKTPPVFVKVPGNINVECSAPQPYTDYKKFTDAGGLATDNCFLSESSFAFVSDQVVEAQCPQIINRTYQIADSCGNIVSFVQKITAIDTTPPILTCPPPMNVIDAKGVPGPYKTVNDFVKAGGVASDNCALNPSSFRLISEVITSPYCPKVVTRVYMVADICGNISECSQDITLTEQALPEIVCPPDIFAECRSEVPPIFETYKEFLDGGGSMTSEENMDLSSFRLQSEISTGKCPEEIIRTYEILDICGSSIYCKQNIVIYDSVPPVINCPDTLILFPGENLPASFATIDEFVAEGGEAYDNCKIDSSSFVLTAETTTSKVTYDIIQRTYRLQDECGNMVSCTFVIKRILTAAFELNCPPMIKVECRSDVPPAYKNSSEFINDGGVINSNCGIDESMFKLENESSDNKKCPETITRTYSVSDLCGNTSVCRQQIIIYDKTPPVIECPEPLYISCRSEIPVPDISKIVATDNCGLVEIKFVEDKSDNNTCPEKITRTYIATDVCGNSSTCNQLIIINDTIPPTITRCPLPTILQCRGDIPAPDINVVRATDNCGTVTIEFVGDVSDGKRCPEVISRTYRATDACGNSTLCTTTFTVRDIFPPSLSCPPDTIIGLSQVVPVPFSKIDAYVAAGGSVSDNCGIDPASFRMVSEMRQNNPCDYTLVRVYEVADSCGNLTRCSQRLTVLADTPPQFISPANLVFECTDDLPQAYQTLAEFRNAGGVATSPRGINESSFRLISESADGKSCPETVKRKYQITDNCGTTVTSEQTIIINDTIKPVFAAIPVISQDECAAAEAYNSYASFIAAGGKVTDNCGIDTASFRLANIEMTSQSCPMVIIRTYQIADLCGNIAEFNQTISVDDHTKPEVINIPADLISDCETPLAFTDYKEFTDAGGYIADNCGLDENSFRFIEDIVVDSACPRIISRSYSIADICGNSIEFVHRIIINDTIPPVVVKVPDDIISECSMLPAVLTSYESYIQAGAVITDNCGLDNQSFALVSELRSGVCPTIITRIYRMSDLCGNAVDLIQTIMAFDNTPPVMSCPDTIRIEPNITIPAPYKTAAEFIVAGGTLMDMCSLDSNSFRLTSEISDGKLCPETVTRTYEVSDSCGNKTSCSQVIIIDDITAPVIKNPKHLILECIGDVPKPFATVREFRDAGGVITDNWLISENSFRLVSEVDDGKKCPKLITRTYEVADSCGNVSSTVHYITVSDLTKPELIAPQMRTVECFDEVPPAPSDLIEFIAGGGIASDNCGYVDSSFTFMGEVMGIEIPRILTRTFSLADSCGNTAITNQYYTILDSIAPFAVCNEIEVTLDSLGGLTLNRIDYLTIGTGSFDNCTDFMNLSFDLIPNSVDCSNIGVPVEVTLMVGDEVGNFSTCTTTVIVRDESLPVANCKDIDVYLDITGKVTITKEMVNNNSYDNCGIRTMYIDKNRFDCNDVGDNLVELTLIDNFANMASCTSVVTVHDTIPPSVICRDLILEIGANDSVMISVADIDAGSFDACGIDTLWINKVVFTCEDIGVTYDTLYAVDVNGNRSECVSRITVKGNEAPVATDDLVKTVMDKTIKFNFLQNDFDPNGKLDTTSLVLYQNMLNHGKLIPDTIPGSLTFVPDSGFVGSDTIKYSICDDSIPCGVMCDTAYIFFLVTPSNEAPVAVADSFHAGCLPIIGSLLDNDYDPDGDDLEITVIPEIYPLHGTVIIKPDGTFTYTHAPGFIGIDSMVYEICDVNKYPLCATATVYITTMPDNDCDGIPNIDDIDDDDDGILDTAEGNGKVDTDADGIYDSFDIDSDNDGIVDNIEGQGEDQGVYILPAGLDSNGNGWDDAYDPASGGYHFEPVDTDDDGIPDFRDSDSDGDHVPDYIEGHDANADGKPDRTRIYQDKDFDGLDDAWDSFDRLLGRLDTRNAISSNAPVQDFDKDGIRDWRDIDDDNDATNTVDEDLNEDGIYANDDIDLDGHPEYLDLDNECELFVPEAFSPNGDGIHDNFKVYCMIGYPDAIMIIFDRDGHEIYRQEHYGNLDYWGTEAKAWWDGTSDSRWIQRTASGKVPPGNYLYVLILDEKRQEKGTVMVNY